MPEINITQLPQYMPTQTAIYLFERLEGVICLSGSWNQPNTLLRYDIISAAPSHRLREQNNQLFVTTDNKTDIEHLTCLEWLDRHFQNPFFSNQTLGPDKHPELPTAFGFIGYMSYDYGRLLETLPDNTINDTRLPDVCGGIYHWNFVNDHQTQTSYLLFADSCPESTKDLVLAALINTSLHVETFSLKQPFQKNSLQSTYKSAFSKIKHYISEGDCYQINYAHRHQTNYTGSAAEAYLQLKTKINTPYSAYLDFKDHHIISLSPEQFIKVTGNHIQTKPIKGTRPRGLNTQQDTEQVIQLQNSLKDRAENLMIVDLLRNDLNRTCIPGSVKVPNLFNIETYPNVHHLVSTITGEKPESTSALEVFKQAFPGGSITGAPKIRAMEIIEELEPTRRSIYCGSIFYAGFDGSLDSNICIRTLLCKDNTMYCWGGGGIVADSNCEDEYHESITKIKNLMDELEAMSGL